MKELAEILKEKRKSKNLTQGDVAKILRINTVTYGGYERGEHEPDLNSLIVLADFYETSVDYLIGRYSH